MLFTASCGSGDRERDLIEVSDGFHAALERRGRRRRLLTRQRRYGGELERQEKRPCSEAILADSSSRPGHGPPAPTSIVTSGYADLPGARVAFLDQGPGGLAVSAAGCVPSAPVTRSTASLEADDAGDVRPLPDRHLPRPRARDRRRAPARVTPCAASSSTTASRSSSSCSFPVALVLQAIAGHADFNEDQLRHGDPGGLARPLRHLLRVRHRGARELAVGVPAVHALHHPHRLARPARLTRVEGAGKAGPESDRDQRVGRHAGESAPRWARARGLKLSLYENSLLIVMVTIWIGSWVAQSITGVVEYNAERLDHQEAPVSWAEYLTRADFWEKTLQNWQSSSSRSARWRSSPSTSASAAPPSRSRWGRLTTPPARKADRV